MSARVFNPMVMSEFQRLVSRNSSDTPGQLDGNALTRVRRNLFGPVDHEDNIKLVDRELAAASLRDSEKWGFDFMREKPFKPGTSRYVWERVMPDRDTVPEPYALRRLPYLQKNTDNSIVVGSKSSMAKCMSALQKPTDEKPPLRRTTKVIVKQSRITDFLKNRKKSMSKAIDLEAGTKTVGHSLRSHQLASSQSKKAV